MNRQDHESTAEIMRLLLVTGFCLGVVCGVFFTGLIVSIHR